MTRKRKRKTGSRSLERLVRAHAALQEIYDNAMIRRGNDDDPLICYDRKSFIARLREALDIKSPNIGSERERELRMITLAGAPAIFVDETVEEIYSRLAALA